MSHITEFAIEGLAGRKDIYAQKLNRDVNIFFGLNGSGKTSLLKILHSALEDSASILRNVPFISAEVKIYSVAFDTVFTRKIHREELLKILPKPGNYWVRSVLIHSGEVIRESEPEGIAWKTEPKLKEKPRGLRHRYLPTSRLWIADGSSRLAYRFEDDILWSEEQLDMSFQAGLERLWAVYIREVLTKVRSAQETGLAQEFPLRGYASKRDVIDL